ncbi:M35 family metallo-endopeptidase [Falsiroseomonas sp.]|uniref:M35 family metallo-endopeptidase n=1 Tax=Falsiroseomonas sp. TaxID=2870721 RepID=UPI003F6E4830
MRRRNLMVGLGMALAAPTSVIAAEVACSPNQMSVARAALQRAKTAMNTSISRLEAPDTNTVNRLQEWFGRFTPPTVTRVKDILTRAVVFTDGVSFRCLNVSQGVYAYVYSSRPFGITLGDLFFPAPELGFDSKPGVLIHEMTHFTLVGGTGDAGGRYGVAAARQRAIADPNLALRTADNFEYFVESIALQ